MGLGAGDNHALALRAGRLTPFIQSQPVGQVVLPGATATFSIQAFGLAGLHYQWQLNGVSLAGATNATLSLTNVQASNGGTYRVVVSTGAGTVTSATALLTVVGPPQVVSTTPSAGATNWLQAVPVDLSIEATASGQGQYPLGYQWQHNGTNISYSTLSNYTIRVLSPANEGSYTVTVTNAVGSTNVTWQLKILPPGSLYAWGANDHGQVEVPPLLTNVMAVAGGYWHTLVVEDGGTVTAWGDNADGQTTLPSGLSNIIAVAAGTAHSLALKDDGGVIAWGRHDLFQTNVPQSLTNAIAISAGGQQSLALRKDGTVVQWGQTYAAIPTGLSNVTAIASGTNFHLALSNTMVVAWGSDDSGQTSVPTNLSNVVGIAAGARHGLALKANGTVTAWGQTNFGQCNVPVGLSNVLAVAAGCKHSLALKNDGTVVAWGDGAYGQTNPVATLSGVKAIASGANHSLAAIFSLLVQYPVDVTKDLLLIYNINSPGSSNVCSYYLQHRPMVREANVLGVGCTANESMDSAQFTNQILAPMQGWLAANPTKHPQYAILFPAMPTRVWGYVGTNWSALNSVAFGLSTNFGGIQPFITSINMGYPDPTNACIAYINKLEQFGTNYSPGKPLISASDRGYANTNYLLDDIRHGTGYVGTNGDYNYSSFGSYVWLATNGLLAAGVPQSAIFFYDELETLINGFQQDLTHPTGLTNLAGYICWGAHSSLDNQYPVNGKVVWGTNSSWWIIETLESFNGQPLGGMGNFTQWFSQNAFGGVNYENTPVGAVSHTDEPTLFRVNDPSLYFGLWASGKNFAISAWYSRRTEHFQAVGDPFVKK